MTQTEKIITELTVEIGQLREQADKKAEDAAYSGEHGDGGAHLLRIKADAMQDVLVRLDLVEP